MSGEVFAAICSRSARSNSASLAFSFSPGNVSRTWLKPPQDLLRAWSRGSDGDLSDTIWRTRGRCPCSSLCCALIHDPDLLILDEPTTGVDPLSRRQFWELINTIRARRLEAPAVSSPVEMYGPLSACTGCGRCRGVAGMNFDTQRAALEIDFVTQSRFTAN